jgi:hypothetical protein
MAKGLAVRETFGPGILLFCPNEELAGGRSEVCMPVVTAIECDDLNVYSSRCEPGEVILTINYWPPRL